MNCRNTRSTGNYTERRLLRALRLNLIYSDTIAHVLVLISPIPKSIRVQLMIF